MFTSVTRGGLAAEVLTAPERPQRAGSQTSPTVPRKRTGAWRSVWVLYGVMGVLLAAYLGYLLARRPDGDSSLIDGWLVAGLETFASLLCIWQGLRSGRRRAMPLVLGAALLSWSIGDVVLTAESLGGATPPTPSLADVFYLGFFPLTYVAVVLFVRGEVRRLSTPSWLDSAIAGSGAAAVCATFVFHSVLHTTGGDTLSVATNLAYPVGDVLLLLLVAAGTVVRSGRRKAPWLLLAGGLTLNVVGDTFNLLESSGGVTHVGRVVDGMAWPAAIVLMSSAVWLKPGHADPLSLQKPTSFGLPGLAATAGLMILIVGTLRQVEPVAVGLATGTLLLVGVRLALSVRGLRWLTAEREHQSITDDLTGLRNRRHLHRVLDGYFAEEGEASEPRRRLAFLFIDLNGFKEINDSFGHPTGDEVLTQLGVRLGGALRASDLLVRLGGDEFAALLLDAGPDQASDVAHQLAGSLERPFELDGVTMNVGASIGIAVAPDDATDAGCLVRCADLAMYRAKLSEVPVALYEDGLDERENPLRLAEELREAVQAGELVLHYQPQLDLHSGEVASVEALVRWPHPRVGLIPPLKFLPLAEDAGLMGSLTHWVLSEALQQCAVWRAGGRSLNVSVNISATSLLEPGFADRVCDLLAQHHLEGDALVLEITETCVIGDFDHSKAVIEELRDLGVTISIDDFGTGFTSMAYLSRLAVKELKLDRSFITALADSEQKREQQLVRATIDFGHALGLRVVAEGVEDDATLKLLSGLGCDVAQGYLISKPKPASQLAIRPHPLAAPAIA
jgi:diguanylate cyclase (GGDEF)-like protein